MTTPPPTSLLVDLPDATLWSSRPWPEFRKLRSPARHVAILPLFGFADWGLGRSLDLEEILGCGVLRAMLASAEAPPQRHFSILPPLRFLLGPYPSTVFGIDFETAHELVREIAASVRAAGLRRLLLFTTSPWNEEFAETCACDMRVDLGMQTFVVNLAGLGLDLHPTRSTTRGAVQAAACALTRRAPADEQHARTDLRLIDFRPGNLRQPAPLPFTRSLDAATAEGWTVLAAAGARLGGLLRAMHARAPIEPAPRVSTSSPRRSAPRRRP